MRIGLGQFNAIVGDLDINAEKMRGIHSEAMKYGVDLLVFPELAICGYPPEDLLLKKHFMEDNRQAVERLAADCPEKTMIVGFAEMQGKKCYNSAAIIKNGKIIKIYRKKLLPNYGVFDEQRYFSSGDKPVIVKIDDIKAAITICQDIWDIPLLGKFLKGAEPFQLLVNISASPYHMGKTEQRKRLLKQNAKKFKCAVSYCNLVGGQDEIIFDGRSMLSNSAGKIVTTGKAFEEDLIIADVSVKAGDKVQVKLITPGAAQPGDDVEEVYKALLLGTQDYTFKNGFKKVLLGLSGGIDSSVVAAIAVDALGKENVIGITLPSQFNSPETITDAGKLAKNLGIEFLTIPIGQILEQFDGALHEAQGWDSKGLAYENLQARIRGTILMSLSNQFGTLVLTTGNKSETAVGYSTLYGDTAGGFAVIKDVPKSFVYKLAEYINKTAEKEIIPVGVIMRPPTAELRANQKDSDSLPEYDLLDRILKRYVEEDKSARELIDEGLPKKEVCRVIRMVDRNEYKRRQSPPGVKITPKAFGKDRRLPITNHYSSCNGEDKS